MIANGLIKTLSAGKHDFFVDMIDLENQTNLLFSIQKEENLRETLKSRTGSPTKNYEIFAYGTNAFWYVWGFNLTV